MLLITARDIHPGPCDYFGSPWDLFSPPGCPFSKLWRVPQGENKTPASPLAGGDGSGATAQGVTGLGWKRLRRLGPGATGAAQRPEPTRGGLTNRGEPGESSAAKRQRASRAWRGGGERGNSRGAGLRRGSPDLIRNSAVFAVVVKILKSLLGISAAKFQDE